MHIRLKTHKMLWGRAANRCAFPDCRQELAIDSSETDDEALVGEECHIIARELNGPRGNHQLPLSTRDKYSNLILLCSNHHTLIDKQPNTYTIQILQEMKAQHEKWVKENLTDFDPIKQKDDERYATYIEDWVSLNQLNEWIKWMDWLFFGNQPSMQIEHYRKLEEIDRWIMSRLWPKRYPTLEQAFENYRRILKDLIEIFNLHAFISEDENNYKIEMFYRHRNPKSSAEHDKNIEEYSFYLDFLTDLGLELTRAANLICDRVREYVDPSFRIREGVILVASPHNPIRTEYQESERILSFPYRGLKYFLEDRKSRDKKYYTAWRDKKEYYQTLSGANLD